MIHLTDSGYPPGTIILAAGAQPRYYEFQMSLDAVGAPVGTKLHIERSCDITQNFNGGVKKMIGEWAWFLADDHSFEPTTLMRFLKHDVDVVVPISPSKVAPWMPCVLHGPMKNAWVNGGANIWDEDMLLYDWNELSGEGLFALPKGDFIGQAGMLVKKHVLDEIGYPWFKCGQLDAGRLQEDLMFCHELQSLGYTVWIDQDVIFDHHFINAITARRYKGKWVPAMKSSNKHVMVLPEAKPEMRLNTEYLGVKRALWEPLPDEAAYTASLHGRPVGDELLLKP